MDEIYYYGKFIEKQLEEKNITLEKLGRGLFTANGMQKIELGERYPQKLTRDRLLARLGESGYDYECFLQPEEYADWKERQKLLDCLDACDLAGAEMILKMQEGRQSSKEKVVRQFFLTMQAQWMVLNGNPETEICRVLEQALELTVPEADKIELKSLVLSMQELNLLLEYRKYRNPEMLKDLCTELLQYVKQHSYDLESKAMLGAKAALYFCNAVHTEVESGVEPVATLNKLEEALMVCSTGIEALRNHQKLYYAWELLQKKRKISGRTPYI